MTAITKITVVAQTGAKALGDPSGILGFDLCLSMKPTTHEVIYQAVMRTSLRESRCTDPVSIVVPDRHAATKLQGLIGATSVTKLGNNIESPKPRPLTAAVRKRRSKVTKHIQAPVCGEKGTKLVYRHKLYPNRRKTLSSLRIPLPAS